MSDAEVEARVTRLAVYPVKGLGGQLLEEVEVQDRGFIWDRRWMLVGGRSSVFDAAPATENGDD